jgi:hypothetical protein
MEEKVDICKYITEKEITDSLLILSNKRLDEYEKKYKIKLNLEKNKKYYFQHLVICIQIYI